MAKKNYTPEQIISKLHQVEVLLSQGKTQDQAVHSIRGSAAKFHLSIGR